MKQEDFYPGPLHENEDGYIVDTYGRIEMELAPLEFSTAAARDLLERGAQFGIICYQPERNYCRPARHGRYTAAQLAYWCERACAYLGLKRNETTYWRPFEDLLGLKHGYLSGATGRLERNYAPGGPKYKNERLTGPIDAFFDALDAEPPRANLTSTESEDNNTQTI